MIVSKLGYSSSCIASGSQRSARETQAKPPSKSDNKLLPPRRLPPVRATRKLCQERLACKGPKCIAVYRCLECGTVQCEACETLLHENPKFLFHDRNQLEQPSADLLCDHICETRNLADVTCESCNKKLCLACDAIIHFQGKAKCHVREPFVTEDEEFLSCPEEESQQSLSPDEKMMSLQSLPDVASSAEGSTCVTQQPQKKIDTMIPSSLIRTKSFLLIDELENLKINSESEFVILLGCDSSSRVKVISIFGNTGEGKSHTLNHTFFKGFPVFKTSSTQSSCTIGVWVAYEPTLNVIILDTEGLLGLTSNHNQRTRLLLKILAISDVIVYRTRAERLHNDLFTFLGDASRAYIGHFSQELKMCSKNFNFEGTLSFLGPAVIIFHETVHTDVLSDDKTRKPEEALKSRFRDLDRSIDAFSALVYIGTKSGDRATSFAGLQEAVKKALLNSSIRSPRPCQVIYKALKALNEKFSGDIDKMAPDTFPMEYFTCSSVCMSCEKKCENSVNHTRDNLPHACSRKCQYKHQFDNKIFLCKVCFERGEEEVVVPKTAPSNDSGWLGLAKYAISGYVLECNNCGVIYRSRQYWYGNEDPDKTAVRVEIRHVWPGNPPSGTTQTNQNAAQRVLDGVNYISDAVTAIGAPTTKTIGAWISDQLAPNYWRPNYAITSCHQCKQKFQPLEKKHHCRACGEGFCEACSSKTFPVPERGWGETPVRVCDGCYEELNPTTPDGGEKKRPTSPKGDVPDVVTVRKVTEVIHSALGSVASAIDIPARIIKDSARPSYWRPDDDIKECIICQSEFSSKLPLHHCRACGQGVCDPCSSGRRPVPSRGWDYDVRVCKACFEKSQM